MTISTGATRRHDPAHWLAFVRAWARDPLRTAAVSPSGTQLARLMVAQLPAVAFAADAPVIELGAGTGVFTQALLDAGVAPQQLLVIELNRDLHRILMRRFPRVRVECADACHIAELAARHGIAGHSVAAVISGLGLLSMPRAVVARVIAASTSLLHPQGRLVQFTYGPFSPVPPALRERHGLRAQRCGVAWRNMPPATVYSYRHAAPAPARPAAAAD